MSVIFSTLKGFLYGDFHPGLKFQLGFQKVEIGKKMQLYEKYQPELKYYSLEQIEKFLPQILYCLMDTRISSFYFFLFCF